MVSQFETAEAEMRKEAESLKRMYNLAKEIMTFSRKLVLYEIVEEAVDVNCKGAVNEQSSRNREEVKEAWIKDAKMFAAIGHTISATLYGKDHSETKQWKAKSSESIKFFFHKVAMKILQ